MYQSKPCNSSFVKISSKDLIKKVTESLEKIQKRRAAEVQKLIDEHKRQILKERESKRDSIWSAIFGYKEEPMPTDAEILSCIEKGIDFLPPETCWIDLKYDKHRDVAYRLLNAARYADEVYVSTEDLEDLL